MVSDSQSRRVVSLVGGSHVVNHAYFMLLPPIFGPLKTELGLTDAQLGIALGTVGVVVTALQLPLGSVSDSRGRTPVLAFSLFFGALGAILTATAQNFTWLLVASVVTGLGIAGHHPAHYPLISAATTQSSRGRAYSIHGFTGTVGFAAPPAIVALFSTLGLDWRLAIGSIAGLGALYGVAAIWMLDRHVDDEITRSQATQSIAGESLGTRVRRELRTVLASPPIVALTVLWFVTSMAGFGIKQYTAVLLSTEYPIPEATANLAVSAMLVTGAVLIFGGGWLTDRISPGPVLFAGYVALIVVAGTLAVGVLPTLGALALVLFLSATIDASRPARATLADLLSTDDSVGKNFGLLTIGISGGAAVAPPVLGLVVERAGVEAAFWVIAGLGAVAIVLTGVVFAVAETAPRGTPLAGD